MAQTAAQPGILTCWLDLLALTSSSAEFYCAPIPGVLRGKPYVDLRRCARVQLMSSSGAMLHTQVLSYGQSPHHMLPMLGCADKPLLLLVLQGFLACCAVWLQHTRWASEAQPA